MAVAVLTLGAISGDYRSLKGEVHQLQALRRQGAEQQAVIESFHSRITEVRGEVASWRALHAKIWEPFGPEAGPAKHGTGIGGGAGLVRAAFPGERVALSQEFDRLTDAVNEEGRSLRALARFLARARRALAALPTPWPGRGAVKSEFAQRLSPWTGAPKSPGGRDIRAVSSKPVKAPEPGTLVFVGSRAEHGQTLMLDHGNDLKPLDDQLQQTHLTQGQRVQRGQVEPPSPVRVVQMFLLAWGKERWDEARAVAAERVTVRLGGEVFTLDLAAGKAEVRLVLPFRRIAADRKSTRLNSSHIQKSRMPSSA